MEELKYAEDLIKTSNSSFAAGFNMFVMGHSMHDCNKFYDAMTRLNGFILAQKMAREGKIFFTHKFKCKCGGEPLQYGGFWVCNKCGKRNVDEEWWKVRVEKDGDEFCAHGIDFENIQESYNYAFGRTFDDALAEYAKLMSELPLS